MKLYTSIVNPLLFGSWVLRSTNDINIENCINYIIIQEDPIVKLKTLKQDGLFGIKKSRTAYITNINLVNENVYTFNLHYSFKNVYSSSFLSIEIPEFQSSSLSYHKELSLTLNLYDKTIVVTNNDNLMYYVFDLYIGKLKYPNIETNVNTFIFTQIFSIILSILFTKLF